MGLGYIGFGENTEVHQEFAHRRIKKELLHFFSVMVYNRYINFYGEKMMELQKLELDFTVCKVASVREIDMDMDFYFISKTDKEISLVCPTKEAPANTIEREDGWRAFRIKGTLDFALVGILSRISTILADNNIGIFAVSTYNTDYILVKKDNWEQALAVLSDKGYEVSL